MFLFPCFHTTNINILKNFFFLCKKIADDMKPNPVVITVLTMLCKVIPTWKMIPTEDVVEMAFKEPEKRAEVCVPSNLLNPISFE